MGATAVLPHAGRAVLSRAHRLTTSQVFAETVRRGRRAGSPRLVVHVVAPAELPERDSAVRPRVGFVVSRSVGPAVTRNLVKRRLRHLVRDRIAALPAASVLVVRALPAAATSSYDALGEDLDVLLGRALRRSAAKVTS